MQIAATASCCSHESTTVQCDFASSESLPKRRLFGSLSLAALLVVASFDDGHAQIVQPQLLLPIPASLKTRPVPKPSNFGNFIVDEAAAIRLGKALFWDM